MKKLIITIVLIAGIVTAMQAQQFGISAEIRPRFENRHGYKTLIPTDADGANFISQRSRLNFDYNNDKVTMRLSLQNVRVWGDVSTLSVSDNANAIHEAWAQVHFSSNISLKLGRQEIVYDDHRIFGSVGWAQQARSHDAFVFKVLPNDKNRLDIGFAINADTQANMDVLYSNVAGYKNFQYAWYHRKFNDFGLSLLLLNTGVEYDDVGEQKVAYLQTVGPRLTYKMDKLQVNASAYLQTGKKQNTDVNALYYSANLSYNVADDFKVGLGYEFLSGKDMDATFAEINTFQPLFGTNHKFNGWMDYFYVGYANSTGLQDINFALQYKKGKFSAKLIPHIFYSAAKIYDGTTLMDSNLGTEIDFTLGYSIAHDVKVSAGYSAMMATETMEVIKSGDKDENNAWGWVMFTFKPNLFTHNMK
jgi:hypothetical protein